MRESWSMRWKDPRSGVEITISSPAQKNLGPGNTQIFLRRLAEFMVLIESDRAYVSKNGRGLAVFLSWSLK